MRRACSEFPKTKSEGWSREGRASLSLWDLIWKSPTPGQVCIYAESIQDGAEARREIPSLFFKNLSFCMVPLLKTYLTRGSEIDILGPWSGLGQGLQFSQDVGSPVATGQVYSRMKQTIQRTSEDWLVSLTKELVLLRGQKMRNRDSWMNKELIFKTKLEAPR